MLKDQLVEELKLNEQYHDSKQNAIWLGFALLYTYCVGSVMFIIANATIINFELTYCISFLVFDLLIFWFAFSFLRKQIERKCISVFLSKKMRSILANYTEYEAKIWLQKDSTQQETDVNNEYNSVKNATMDMEKPLVIISEILVVSKFAVLILLNTAISTPNGFMNAFLFLTALFYLMLFINTRNEKKS